ncbi:MAG TPA: PQQ-binding-like beta-propeller repeat protein, partial [Candidatus Hydrogenedentes bacterium]|nr:PQQ-binding-like beta-propeller repeat protein [Candidatus Hydrogenedentota bacterium]
MNLRFLRRLCAAACLFPVCAAVHAGDQPQWGAAHSRNMVSAETGLPDAVAAEGDGGPLWSVGLGDNSYGTPVVAGGRVYIGANNLNPVDARLQGDYGLLYCLSEKDGALLWKLGTPRIGGDDYLDWPGIAVCSPPTV